MTISEVSRRYSRALYELANSHKVADRVFQELRVLAEVFQADAELFKFIENPVVPPDQKIKVFQGALSGKVSDELLNTLLVMAGKNRLHLILELLAGYELLIDEAHGVTRGTVRSAKPVSVDERKRIEETVKRVTGKKVILSFEEDSSLLGGMVTQVGGWTFDDSLQSHLNKMMDELNRRAN